MYKYKNINFTQTQTFTSVACGPSVGLVAPNLCSCVCVCVHILLAATCRPKPQSAALHKAYPHQSSPKQVLLACHLPSLTAGCRSGVWWSGPDLIRRQPHPFSVCCSHTSISASDLQAAQTPAPTRAVYAQSPQYWLVCICVFVPTPINSHLILSPHSPQHCACRFCSYWAETVLESSLNHFIYTFLYFTGILFKIMCLHV